MIERAVKLRPRRVNLGVVAAEFWLVLPARPGKGSRTQIGPAHLNRELAARWAIDNNYIVLGAQPRQTDV